MRRFLWSVGGAICLLAVGGAASAQENLNTGKTPAELYASDCAICHKSPNGLASKVGIFGLTNFLREHYTSSVESAAVISAYLQSIDREPAGHHAQARRPSKAGRKAKLALPPRRPSDDNPPAKKPEDKSATTTSAKTKPGEHKPSQSKPSVSKPSATKSSAGRPSAPANERATDTAKSKAKPEESKTESSKAAGDKPASSDKDAKPEKSD